MSKKRAAAHYFDSSVILRYAVGHPQAMQRLDRYAQNAFTSVLARVECLRVLDRWRITREIEDERLVRVRSACLKILDGLRLIEIDAGVIEIASQTFPIALKSLDALHLATAIRLKHQDSTEVIMLTHDQKLALAALAAGLSVLGADISS